MSRSPNLEQIKDITKQNDEVCREAQLIRERIAAVANEPPIWPDRRRASRVSAGGSDDSEVPPHSDAPAGEPLPPAAPDENKT